MNKILELLKLNSSNEDYVIGDALLEFLPIDYIKPSELGGSSVRVCSEEDEQLVKDFVNTFEQIEELISNNDISFSKKTDREIIGSTCIMHFEAEPKHEDRIIKIQTILNVWDVISSHYITPGC